MKSGLLLLQSVASSTLRCVSRSSSLQNNTHRFSRHDTRRRSLLPRSTSSLALSHHASDAPRSIPSGTHGRVRASPSSLVGCKSHRSRIEPSAASNVFGMLCAVAFSTTSLAVCSNGDSGTAPSDDADERFANPVKNIDEPTIKPEHHAACPFPEEALRHDTYQGLTLDISKLLRVVETDSNDTTTTIAAPLSDPEIFQQNLQRALKLWHSQNRRGIWLRIPSSHSHLIPPSVSLGFDFRHAEPGYCVLTKWLPADASFGGPKTEKDAVSRLPHGPTHQVGVGVLVLHPRTGKMLAVQEKSGPAAARKLWKMPTGLTDPGEDIAAAAIRELKEETGLDCVFDRIICFRQAHGGLFNRSDMFFVCLCKLSSKYNQLLEEGKEIELLPQEEEILCANWIDMEDYARQKVWKESPLYKEMNGAMLRAARRGIEYSGRGSDDGDTTGTSNHGDGANDEIHGFVAKNLPVGFRPGNNTIYVSSKL
ncbi:hypothetical protein ACHAWX_007152 [Stephanocyclus meneghinianus]